VHTRWIGWLLTISLQSCRTLRSLLQDSKSVWSAVVKDLLEVSPYGVIRLSVPRATGAQLRSLAVRYNVVDKALSTENISHTTLETSFITLSPSVKQVRMIPASSVLIHIATTGSLHMTSTKTGESILTWLPPEPLALDHVTLRMESSPTIGTILTVKLFPRRFVTRGNFWCSARCSTKFTVPILPTAYRVFGFSELRHHLQRLSISSTAQFV
jgi:hypothetical protein